MYVNDYDIQIDPTSYNISSALKSLTKKGEKYKNMPTTTAKDHKMTSMSIHTSGKTESPVYSIFSIPSLFKNIAVFSSISLNMLGRFLPSYMRWEKLLNGLMKTTGYTTTRSKSNLQLAHRQHAFIIISVLLVPFHNSKIPESFLSSSRSFLPFIKLEYSSDPVSQW